METNRFLAQESQRSAINIEAMTEEMHSLAVKTKQETVSMRIITLVTLFFLPGTFISTLMSTDIVHYDGEKKVVSLGALELFFAISIPMMVGTFGAWYLVYWWVDRRARLEKLK
ncbi:hypothetical protein K490DRAFT_45434 [Saccharata proteae CBS 121410]|uniref:Uncharacterized protein n=1 Tax=Saccharata proteae CBS 121410 TaxID=1314787 RepID=A0A9P4HQE9_9PEZI|nr:hypothetical protein K490DRAFT_45434 [Saccharata proteae CBS 121410]